MIDQYKENELLRMTKDELIEHIFKLYHSDELKWQRLVEWETAFDQMKQLRESDGIGS